MLEQKINHLAIFSLENVSKLPLYELEINDRKPKKVRKDVLKVYIYTFKYLIKNKIKI